MFKFKIILLIILTAASANILNAEPIDLSMDNGFAVFRFNDASASKISVAGTFNEWNKNANFLSKNSEGIWELKLKLNEGSYEYKYVINDDNWV
ncbi:MAG TPA: glycogen-binding domain-containing protein, partial [bacterium]|nr:glycogen-binding domain-containing protein [bacterium]